MFSRWKECRLLIRSDLYRYEGNVSRKKFLLLLFSEPGFRYSALYRFGAFLAKKRSNIFGKIIYRIFYEILRHYQIKYGIYIHPNTTIEKGFYIGHHGGIVINDEVIIGKNCNISQGITVGQSNRGQRKGSPVIGDNVYIGPGAVIFGKIQIGNNVAIGANAVVTKDIPDNAVVVGNPGHIISYNGSTGYINRTDY